ncbi:MAG: glycosyltransferase family 4 protein [Chitinophagaceae bacterium]|nr:glycosyltransferase family 4 protein [Chitinophagaceae bacterium]MBP7108204.1 glycosyltransferase family 4 protein [Chitinophagaceae bacterium]
MTIAINCWILRNKKLDGIGYFTVNTVANLIRQHPEIQFQILCDKKFTEDYFDFPNVTKHKIFPALRHPILYVIYMELVLPFFLRKHKPDLMVSMDSFLSLLSGCKQIPVIYDINFEHKPEDIALKNRIYYRFFTKRFAKKAKRIATISEYSKRDIADFYKIDATLIDNVSCGINSNFSPLSKEEITAVRDKWSEGKPYFFFVGSMHPRKNIKRLIDGFNLFKERTQSDFKLVLAGSLLWQKTDIEDSYTNSQYKDDIIFTGRLSDDDLQKVLGAAYALSFVPIFEGFGLPIVEAFQSGVPVICSNVTSMPEVAGDAALMVDPFNIDSIANGMNKLADNNDLRNELIDKGHQQKKLFSWSRTAELLWDCIQKAVK